MLRFRPSTNASQGYFYFEKSDAGLDASDLQNEVGGKAAKFLWLDKNPDFDQFKNLLNGLDPRSGQQLTAKIIPGRISYWDVTASVPKGVTTALERGDQRIHDVIWEAGREAMADIESMITTRIRKGGEQDDRTTGNMIWYGFEHPETRPNRDDGMPDWDRHIHYVIPNLTFDPEEHEWKAIKFRPIMDLRKYFSTRFDHALSSKLNDLGYEIKTEYRPDKRGGMKYYSWDIKGIPQTVIAKNSRRSNEVEKLAEHLGIENPVSKDKLGATSRLLKRDDLTLEDYRRYWNGRITPDEGKKIADVIKKAMLKENPKQQNTLDKATAMAIGHQFERNSVVDQKELEIAAMERSMGAAKPDQVLPELKNQGVLLKDGEATTREVLAQEGRIIDFARERGTMRPLGLTRSKQADLGKLSAEQQQVCNHIWHSRDRVILIEGDAGTGKTQTMTATIPGVDAPGVFVAPSASASRGALREKGFTNADTLARFRIDEEFRNQARNGYVYIDEAGLASINDIDFVCTWAGQNNARIILQGDRKQHLSPARHGNLFPTLEKFAGLPVARLKKTWRFKWKGQKEAIERIAKGDILGAYDRLNEMGNIVQTPVFDHNKPLIDEYLKGLNDKKDILVIAPTHKEADELTGDIRAALKEEGKLTDERIYEQLVPLNWTAAERDDPERYDGTEVIQFFRASGNFKAGQCAGISDVRASKRPIPPDKFAVYRRDQLELSVGDRVRFTSGGKSIDGHRMDNGYEASIAGFEGQNIRLQNGWLIDGSKPLHLTHAYVSTSYASQGKTVDRVLIAMGHESLRAINAAQFYVSASRARETAMIFTDLSPITLRDAISKPDGRKSATEVFGQKMKPKKTLRAKLQKYVDRVKKITRQLQDKAREVMNLTHERASYERGR